MWALRVNYICEKLTQLLPQRIYSVNLYFMFFWFYKKAIIFHNFTCWGFIDFQSNTAPFLKKMEISRNKQFINFKLHVLTVAPSYMGDKWLLFSPSIQCLPLSDYPSCCYFSSQATLLVLTFQHCDWVKVILPNSGPKLQE